MVQVEKQLGTRVFAAPGTGWRLNTNLLQSEDWWVYHPERPGACPL